MSYQPRSTNPYIMEKKLNECVGGGGFDPSVLEEIESEISVLGSENATMAQDIIDIKGSLNSLNDNLLELNKLIVLSTTERKIGTFEDKNVYEKTIALDSVPSSGIIDTSTEFVADNLYAIVSCSGSVKVQGPPDLFLMIGGFYQTGLGCGIITSTDGLKVYAPGYTIKECFVKIQYIKKPT